MKKKNATLTDLHVKNVVTILDKTQQANIQGGNVRQTPPYRISKWTVLETRGNLNNTPNGRGKGNRK